jgi:transcriptional regulator with XRE-family HTH domain
MGRKSNKDRDNDQFSRRLSELMRKKGLSLMSLAREAVIPKSTLHDWSTSSLPTDFKAAARLAKVLNVSLAYLLTGEHDQHGQGDLETLYQPDAVIIDGLAEVRIVRMIPRRISNDSSAS